MGRRKKNAEVQKKKPAPKLSVHEANGMTLKEARDWLRERVKDGAECPCCEQFAKVYKRKLNSSMAYVLIMMVREFRLNGGAWMHVPSMLNRKGLKPEVAASVRGDWAKLAWWGLIEEEKKPDRDTARRTSGSWRPTGAGIAFVNGNMNAPVYAMFYSGRVIRMSKETFGIIDALNEKFDYDELMRGSKGQDPIGGGNRRAS